VTSAMPHKLTNRHHILVHMNVGLLAQW